MTITITMQRNVFTLDELKEIVALAEHQATTDRFEASTEMVIDGNNARIEVTIDDDLGNFTVH